MDSQEFKKVFCEMAKQYGFKTAYGCCYSSRHKISSIISFWINSANDLQITTG